VLVTVLQQTNQDIAVSIRNDGGVSGKTHLRKGRKCWTGKGGGKRVRKESRSGKVEEVLCSGADTPLQPVEELTPGQMDIS